MDSEEEEWSVGGGRGSGEGGMEMGDGREGGRDGEWRWREGVMESGGVVFTQ